MRRFAPLCWLSEWRWSGGESSEPLPYERWKHVANEHPEMRGYRLHTIKVPEAVYRQQDGAWRLNISEPDILCFGHTGSSLDMQFSLTATVEEQASDLLVRWARLIQGILSDLTSLGAPTTVALSVPFFYGFTLGFAVVDDWIDKSIFLWVFFSLSCGFAATAVISLGVVFLSTQVYAGGMEKMITYATIGVVSLPNVIVGVRKKKSRERELERRARRVIRRLGI